VYRLPCDYADVVTWVKRTARRTVVAGALPVRRTAGNLRGRKTSRRDSKGGGGV